MISSNNRPHLFWGTLSIPLSCGSEHFVMIGAPGSGKTTLLHLTMKSVLPTIRLGTNRRAVVYDPKREIYPFLLGMGIPEDRIMIMNPFDRRCFAWDMARDITDPATATEIGTILVPDKGDAQPFFPDAARSLVGGTMEALLQIAPGNWTFRDVVLTLRTDERLKRILCSVESTRHLVEKYLSGTDAHRDISATLQNTMHRLSFVAAAWDQANRSISLERWIHDESILLLGSSPSLESTIQQINSALLHRVTQIILNQPEARFQEVPSQTWVFIDELRRAGRLANLPEFMVEGRSKGACVVLAFQDLPGLIEVFRHNLAMEIIGTARNKAFLKLTEISAEKYCSEHLGQHEVEITRHSLNFGSSETVSARDRSISTQRGIGIQKSLHTRPAVATRQFHMLPEVGPEHGISGYFDTACVGAPYLGNLPWEFIRENRIRPHPSEPAVDPRPGAHQYFREWDHSDLLRLSLSKFPELLSDGSNHDSAREAKPKKNKKPPKAPSPDSDQDGGLLELLPKRPR